ncbi:MAG: hypothetical protein AMXMBFR17_31910 [Candidatus Jettenia caeni]|nr:MAG: hypothetical protein JETCAE04_33310 [Candidatus Jettenia caeni]
MKKINKYRDLIGFIELLTKYQKMYHTERKLFEFKFLLQIEWYLVIKELLLQEGENEVQENKNTKV